MKITAKMLCERGACADGIKEFGDVYPNGYDGEWTRETQVKFIQGPLRKYFGWATRVGLLPMWSMHNADLHNADLSGADLCWANLREAKLSNANLYSADLSGADLEIDGDLDRDTAEEE